MSRYSRAAVLGLLLATSCRKENGLRTEDSRLSNNQRADQFLVKPSQDEPATSINEASPCAPTINQGTFSPVGESGNDTLALLRSRQTSGVQTLAIAADEDEQALHIVDADTHVPLGMAKLAGKPARVLVMQDGRVVVSLSDISALEVLEPTPETGLPFKRRCLVDTAAEPMGLAMTPDQKTLLVATRWEPTLSAFSSTTMKSQAVIDLPRDPTSVMTSHDGKKAFVTHAAGGMISLVDLEKLQDKPASVHGLPLALRSNQTTTRPRIPSKVRRKVAVKMPPPFADSHDRLGSQGFVMARHEKTILAPMVMVEPKPPRGSSSGYGSTSEEAPAVVGQIATIDETTGQIGITPSRAHLGLKDCLLPRAAVVDPIHDEVLVSCLGLDTVIVCDATQKNPHDHEKRRIAVPSGPTGMAIDVEKRQVVVFSTFAGEMSFLPLDAASTPSTKIAKLSTKRSSKSKTTLTTISLPGRQGLPAKIAEGRTLFHAAGRRNVAHDGRVCASCHPDGRDDGLTWQTQEGPRQTPILLGRLTQDTAPFGWLGDKANLPSHFERTIERLEGTGLKDSQREALFAYINYLAPPKSHKASNDERIARGRQIFESAETGCSSCHLGDNTTDGSKHDVNSAIEFEADRKFETPSLRHLARSAPYFHDGRYTTLLEMVKACDGNMGTTKHLEAADQTSLVAYLETL